MSRTKTTVVAVLVLLLTFAGGFMAGAFAHRAVAVRVLRPQASRMMLRHLDLRLDLTDAQHAQIGRILEQRHARLRNELDATNAEIEKVLTPEQRARFARMRMRLHGRP